MAASHAMRTAPADAGAGAVGVRPATSAIARDAGEGGAQPVPPAVHSAQCVAWVAAGPGGCPEPAGRQPSAVQTPAAVTASPAGVHGIGAIPPTTIARAAITAAKCERADRSVILAMLAPRAIGWVDPELRRVKRVTIRYRASGEDAAATHRFRANDGFARFTLAAA